MAKRANKAGSGPQKPILPTVMRLGRETQGYRPHMLGVLVLIGLSTALGLLPPWFIRYAIDEVILPGRAGVLWLIGLLMVAVSLVEGLVGFGQRYFMEWVGQRLIMRLRERVFTHLNRLSFGFYDQSRTGDIMARVTSDADVLNRFLGFGLINYIGNFATIVGILGVMFVWNWRLAVLYLFLLPFMFHALTTYARRVSPLFRVIRRQMAALTEILQETMVGIRVVKIYGAEKEEGRRFHNENKRYLNVNLQAIEARALWMPYINFLVGLGTVGVLWYGGWGVIRGHLSLGQLIGFISYLALLVRPIRQSGMMVGLLLAAVAAAERIFEVLDTEPDVKDRPGAYSLPSVRGRLEIEGVTFAYMNEDPVLADVSFTVEPGQTVALVGPTGAGKSTLLHLIPRFYELQAGSIRIDGHDIRDVTLESLRRQVGIMLQESFIFDGTIRENMLFGAPQTGTAAMIEVARQVELHDFIASLKRGYDTPLGERGVRLSGGQRQRLAMARVLLSNPRILLLDEPTASVDAVTEARIQRALARVLASRTVLVVAHRLWTVQQAHQIVVLAGNRIAQAGTHAELIKVDGPYRKVYRSFLESTATGLKGVERP